MTDQALRILLKFNYLKNLGYSDDSHSSTLTLMGTVFAQLPDNWMSMEWTQFNWEKEKVKGVSSLIHTLKKNKENKVLHARNNKRKCNIIRIKT